MWKRRIQPYKQHPCRRRPLAPPSSLLLILPEPTEYDRSLETFGSWHSFIIDIQCLKDIGVPIVRYEFGLYERLRWRHVLRGWLSQLLGQKKLMVTRCVIPGQHGIFVEADIEVVSS